MTIEIVIKWSGSEYRIVNLSLENNVLDLKLEIKKQTGVLPERQKLLGLKFKGKPPDDNVLLSELRIKPGAKIMMMGTREEALADVLTPPEDLPEVVDDFDIGEEEIPIENRDIYLEKIERRVQDCKIDIINEPREGKKLLVLDIDYTLFDHKSVAENIHELMRPYLHEFLTSAYEDYDIVIWSATSMKWIKAKMDELGVSNHPQYKLCCMVDSLAMITVDTGSRYGVIEVKPLGVLWGKYEQWNKTNTIMFDDLRRNFLMNPQNGLKIRPFRKAHFNREKDRELVKLTKYLKDIAPLVDLSPLNHRKWESYRPKRNTDDTQSAASSSTPPKRSHDDDRS
ncbi:hypothetical protein CAPTEDRAFT_159759 [Capitella teleta]|uniref:Ubiquitin-like domain-containing CTD phosphatase 1 n=1 Tax=Capitella teleta TaxID=283909 RepID=R7UU90_CAPTE|nr:hypothetical protein CAPTEDRAFT_159759 [Capitella teleta]|eukprot:ELU09728.1 hypothetical protein CAPTEDRAFT_159759 [Capitella teleta]